jgi:phosphatidate cytidylyltransferase
LTPSPEQAVLAVIVAAFAVAALAIVAVQRRRGEPPRQMWHDWWAEFAVLSVVLVPALLGGGWFVGLCVVLGAVATVELARTLVEAGAARRQWWALPIPLLALASLRGLPDPAAPFTDLAFFFCVVEANDAFASVVGKAVGRRALAPRISPNKTWEGALGGVLAGTAAATCLGLLLPGIGAGSAALLGLALSVTATGADLAVSAFKRSLGTKDFGSWLPPAGSLLDVYDVFILVAPLWVLARGALG